MIQFNTIEECSMLIRSNITSYKQSGWRNILKCTHANTNESLVAIDCLFVCICVWYEWLGTLCESKKTIFHLLNGFCPLNVTLRSHSRKCEPNAMIKLNGNGIK